MRCLCIAASISSKVQSWCSATRARMRSAYFSRTEQLPPRGFGSLERSSRQRCTHLMAELTLISNKSAASRRDAPASTVPITRSRRSPEYDCGIVGPHRRINAGRLAHFNGLGNPPPPRFRFGGKCCKQHEAPVVSADLEPHYERLLGQGRKADAPLHIDQQRLQIEILIRRLAR